MRYSFYAPLLTLAVILVSPELLTGAEFFPLPQLPGSMQAGDAFAVSADGSTVVGSSHDGNVFQAVRWTLGAEISIQRLGLSDFSFARGVSSDGRTIVGYRAYPGGQAAFRWTEGGGTVELGDLPGGEAVSRALAVSADGNTVVGMSLSAQGGEAFRWTPAAGLLSIGDLAAGGVGGEAFGTSANGTVIVGSGLSDRGTEAFRWTAEGGMVGLGDLPGSGFFSEAYDVSADGSIVVGRSAGGAFPFSYRAFRWTAETGMVALPDIVGLGPTAIAEAVSGDGNVIVGGAYTENTLAAFAWDQFHGTRSIADLLVNQGVILDGFHLGIARGVSIDGRTVAGLGINAVGLQQPWVAELDAGTFVPEPSSLALSAAALPVSSTILVCMRWRRFGR